MAEGGLTTDDGGAIDAVVGGGEPHKTQKYHTEGHQSSIRLEIENKVGGDGGRW
jgi:hypothetical protein